MTHVCETEATNRPGRWRDSRQYSPPLPKSLIPVNAVLRSSHLCRRQVLLRASWALGTPRAKTMRCWTGVVLCSNWCPSWWGALGKAFPHLLSLPTEILNGAETSSLDQECFLTYPNQGLHCLGGVRAKDEGGQLAW